jgi:hypothetical protein
MIGVTSSLGLKGRIMPKVALADSRMDWDTLLTNANRHAEDLPALAERLDELRAVLEKTGELMSLRDRLTAERQQATRELAEAKEEGKQLAIRIRSLLKAAYGPRSGQLAEFGMKPRPSARGASPRELILAPPSRGAKPPRT